MVTISHKVAPAIALRTLRPAPYVGLRVVASAATAGGSVARALQALFEHVHESGLQVEGLPFLVAGDSDGRAVAVEIGIPVAAAPPAEGPFYPGRLPAGRAVVALYQGPHERMAPCYEELRDWISAHRLEPAGAPREVYLNGPADVTSAEQLLTELVWPVG